MKERLKAAFMVVAPESDPVSNRSSIITPAVELLTVFVKNYEEAATTASQLEKDGYKAIELCAGFGNRGAHIVSEAVGYRIPVGVVRFDNHPGLNNMSGDSLF